MKYIVLYFPVLIIPLAVSFFINAGILLLAAVFIQTGVLHMESATILCIISLVISSFTGSYLTVKKSGVRLSGYIYAAVYFCALLLTAFINVGFAALAVYAVRYSISIFSGTIFGNLLGSKAYYKLRNSGKKRLRATK